jgi:hypothetical protein
MQSFLVVARNTKCVQSPLLVILVNEEFDWLIGHMYLARVCAPPGVIICAVISLCRRELQREREELAHRAAERAAVEQADRERVLESAAWR